MEILQRLWIAIYEETKLESKSDYRSSVIYTYSCQARTRQSCHHVTKCQACSANLPAKFFAKPASSCDLGRRTCFYFYLGATSIYIFPQALALLPTIATHHHIYMDVNVEPEETPNRALLFV